MRPIYLDHNATTPLLPEAAAAMRGVPFGNPASAHAAGRAARRLLEDARERVAALLGAQPDEVTFTSGATETNNLAVLGRAGGVSPLLTTRSEETGGLRPPLATILASPLEHPCVIEPLKQLAARGHAVEWLPVSREGIVSAASTDAAFVCVMLANHETGAIQPVRKFAASAVHCDAAQAVGKMPVNFRDLGVASLAASAHKFGGPKGVGVLVLKRGTELRPLFFGGHQQHGRRPGTEPVALAVGMAAALDHAVRHLDENRAKLGSLRARLWERLQEAAPPVVLNGPPVGSPAALPTTLNVSFPGCRAELLLVALDLAGVACSAGSACSSGSLLPSPVLRAMGVPNDVLRSAVRFSFGASLEIADIDDAAGRIGSAVRRMRDAGNMG